MSLPAGASITTIGGKRCTAIPRLAAALNASFSFSATSAAEAVAATTTPAAAATATSSTTAEAINSATFATIPAAAAITSFSSSSVRAVTKSSTSNAVVAAAAVEPSASQSSSLTEALPSSTQSTASPSLQSTSSTDAIEPIVPTTTSATSQVVKESQTALLKPSTTIVPVASSSEYASSVSTAVVLTDSSVTQSPTSQTSYSSQAAAATIGYTPPTQAGENPTQSPTIVAASASAGSKINAGVIVGGIVGGFAMVGILLFLLWRYTKKRKPRDSFMTPLNGSFGREGEKYEIDENSLGPTPLGKKLKAQVGGLCSRIRIDLVDWGSVVKTKFSRDSDAPSVNMDRGNSQFLEPIDIQQHNRSASATIEEQHSPLTARSRFLAWWQRFTENVTFNGRLRQTADNPTDHFTAIRGINEKQPKANQVPARFSQLLVLKDHELYQTADQRRRSQSTDTLPQLGSLGLEFSGTSNPFADPFPNIQPTLPNISKPQEAVTPNPFADTTVQRNSSDYAFDGRRSRGLSQPMPRSAAPVSDLPPSSTVTATDRPRQPSIAAPSSRYPSTIRTSRDTYRDTVLSALSVSGRNARGRSDPFDLDRPDLLQRPPPIPSQTETYSSKYSSGIGAMLSEWGDPGPDIGPFSWKRPGAEDGSIGSNDATRGSMSSGSGSHIVNVGRAL